MPINLQFLVAAVTGVLTIGLAYLDVPLAGPIIGLLGVIVVPGWLLTHLLFDWHQGPGPVVRFILVFGLGASLLALELLVLTTIGIRLTRRSVLLTGAASSIVLLGILILWRRTDWSHARGAPVPDILLLCYLAVPVLWAFVALHQPRLRESYTEFYVVPQPFRTAESQTSEAHLVILSHEREEHIYTVMCQDTAGLEQALLQSVVKPGSNLTIELSMSPLQSGAMNKTRLYLFREQDETPYRWVELIGTDCDQLRSANSAVRLTSPCEVVP